MHQMERFGRASEPCWRAKVVTTYSKKIKCALIIKRCLVSQNIAGNSEEHKKAATLLAISLSLCAF
jgi:hypothetical protein